MTKTVPIAITILRCGKRYLFLQRRNPPYENLWSMVGGKIVPGEHVRSAAVREVMEETGAPEANNYEFRGLVSERLIESDGSLSAHFLIFVSYFLHEPSAALFEYFTNSIHCIFHIFKTVEGT